jgi:membrane dipeptidase
MSAERPNRGFHPILEQDHPWIFVDACVQIWDDSDFANAHRHGCHSYAVTSWHPHAPVAEAMEQLMFWHLIARKYPNIDIAFTTNDIRKAKAEGRTTILLASQCGDFIDDKLHRIEAFYRLGLRYFIPAYNRSNKLADGCLDRTTSGLTRFGELVVRECNRVGMLLDCSHLGKQSSMDILTQSADPVIFSHSNARALVEHPRNIDDEQIKALAQTGGVIGVVAWGPLLFKEGATTRPTVEDVVDHVDYIANLLGTTDNIGVGTDFSLGSYGLHLADPWGMPDLLNSRGEYDTYVESTDARDPRRFAEGFNDYPQVVNFAERLKARGYTDAQIGGILGENFMRVFDQVWK